MRIVYIWLARIRINTRANESFSIDFSLLKSRYALESNAKARKRFSGDNEFKKKRIMNFLITANF